MRNFVYLSVILLLSACSGNLKDKNATTNNTVQLSNNNAITVYEGTLPCADCDGVKTTLTLYHDKAKNIDTYRLQEEYLGQGNNKIFESTGKWTALKGTQEDPKAVVYQLSIQNEDPEDSDVINYLVVDNMRIKLIDDEMNEIDTKQNYILTRK